MKNRFRIIEPLIIVAIAVHFTQCGNPFHVNVRMASNQASAEGSMRTISTAQITYAATFPQKGFACDLSLLGPPLTGTPTELGAGLIDGELASGSKSGYVYTFIGPCRHTMAGVTVEYKLLAAPITPGRTGDRSFCVDETGLLKYYGGSPPTDCFTKGVAR